MEDFLPGIIVHTINQLEQRQMANKRIFSIC